MKNENKICFFNSAKSWGGGEKWHFDMAMSLHQVGYPVLIIGNVKSKLIEKAQQNNIPYYSINVGNLSFLNISKLYRLKSFLKEQNIQTIILNLPADLKLAGIAAHKAGIASIIYRRGSAIAVRNTFFNRYLFKNVITGIIANSQETKNTILQNYEYLFPKEKIKVIYNGIALEKFKSQVPIKKSTEPIVIGSLGRMVEQKMQHHLIDLSVKLKQLSIQHKIIIGGDGPLMSPLKQYASQCNVEENIEFPGFIDNPSSFYSQIDIFVLTSKWEGFGYVLVEAMACGIPVVAYSISSNPEIIKEGHTGFLVPFGDIEALSKTIKLLQNHQLRIEIGENAKKHAKALFSIDRTKAELIDYLGLKDLFPDNS